MNYVAKNKKEQEIIDYFLESYNEAGYVSKFLYNNFFKKIKSALLEIQFNSVLEVGCGLGESSLRIKKMIPDKHFEVSEYDLDYVSILKNSNFPLKVTNETVYNLERSNNSIDCVILLEVLEHLDDYHAALNELFRVSSKYVLISVPNEPLWRILNFLRGKYIKNLGNTPGHINHFNVKNLNNILEKYGKVRSISCPVPWIVMCVEKNGI